MDNAILVFRLLAVSQVVLFLVLMLISNKQSKVRLSGFLFISGVACYLTAPMAFDLLSYETMFIPWFLATLIPASLLLFIWVSFEDPEPFSNSILLLVFLYSAISGLHYFGVFSQTNVCDEHSQQISLLIQSTKLVLGLLSIAIIYKGRENDLVEQRLKLRLLFICCSLFIVLAVIATELITNLEVPTLIETIGMLLIMCVTFAVNIAFNRVNPSYKLLGAQKPIFDKPDDPFIVKLLERMKTERLYSDHDLRVGKLAQMNDIPEHKLRKKINQELGYRNFNQFINRYRIEEAGERLRSTKREPILTIALDVGFRSISSFNVAFNQHYGIPPKQYRQQFLTDS